MPHPIAFFAAIPLLTVCLWLLHRLTMSPARVVFSPLERLFNQAVLSAVLSGVLALGAWGLGLL